MLFKSFEQSCSPEELKPPTWELTLVPGSLTQAPFVLEFVAKTQNPSVQDGRFASFSIPSLTDFVNNDPQELLLCPVTALHCYLKRAHP